jgi:type II restriction/modification system DNA methylase subunit YeeA
MNTNNLKKFAQETRRKLLEQVGARLSFVLTTDSAVLREKADQVKQLREELNRTTKELLIEKVAYTWFNRLMALRFMDANDYQPLGIKVITPKDGYSIPEIMDEAKRGNIPYELKINRKRVFDLLDSRIPSSNPQNEAFKELLIAVCNHLNTVLPFLFERINDYTELLIPDDVSSDFSIVAEIRNGMLAEDCENVEIIGWLYQFYISEKKDEVFASNIAVRKEDIPAATQLFTPRWIVEYLVQNTLGKLWLQNRPASRLKQHMTYYIESPSSNSTDYLYIKSIDELNMLDQACGSGHILVYAFELLYMIYEEEGYSTNEIPQLIIEKNLHGFEIDERAAQLSGFALMMKARGYDSRFLRKEIVPNILCFSDLNLTTDEIKNSFQDLKIELSDSLLFDLKHMMQAKTFGSIIKPNTTTNSLLKIYQLIESKSGQINLLNQNKYNKLLNAIKQLIPLNQLFHCIVDNPPYMGGGKMNKELSEFVKTNYPESKSDLMACFMEAGVTALLDKGFLGMINQHSWMFLSSYENLRRKLITNIFFDTNLHLGARTFPEISGEVVQNTAFTFWNTTCKGKGAYIRLLDYDKSELKRTKTLEAIQNPDCKWHFTANQKDFEKIPGNPIAYWSNKQFFDLFKNNNIDSIGDCKQGLITGDDTQFVRFWHELSISELLLEITLKANSKWIPFNKGVGFAKWYKLSGECVNWFNSGAQIKSFYNIDGKLRSRPQCEEFYLKKGICWGEVSTKSMNARVSPANSIFTSTCPAFFGDENYYNYLLAFLNSIVANYMMSFLSPTQHFTIGSVKKIPFIYNINKVSSIEDLVKYCLSISIIDANSKEEIWDYKLNELVRIKSQNIEESYDLYQQYWENKFFQLHKNEEELNRHFIEIYGLQDELTPDVPLEDITILKEETSIVNGQLLFHADEVFAQFISYAVGCMFGRYSLDKEGLILANHGETLQDYLHKINKSQHDCIFLPDDDNIIPFLEDEWFEDDITGRFYQFLKVTFGEKNFNKNLSFIEEKIGKDIRKYFTRDFYPDHIKRYKKRPIYWMFSSPKGAFNVLIYMHRYTPDTINAILNKYLREFIAKLKTRKEHLNHIVEAGSSTEKTKAIKEIDTIDQNLIELRDYERDILYPMAIERIPIDLDDGVLVNYNKFGKAVKEVSGLNDKKTKEAVKKFDWIDVTQIR